MKPSPITSTIALFATQVIVSAEIDLGSMVGTAVGISSSINQFTGSTTVQPAIALKSHRFNSWGEYHGIQWKAQRSITLNVVTGEYVYESFHCFGKKDDKDYRETRNTEAFALENLSLLNYSCTRTDPGSPPFKYNQLESFSLAVMASSISKNGYLPPSGPFTAWIKSTATAIASSCNEQQAHQFEHIFETRLPESGFSIARPNYVNFQYSWPMRIWVGGPFDQ